MNNPLLNTPLPTDGQTGFGDLINTAITNLRLYVSAIGNEHNNHNHPISAIVGLQNTLTSLQNTLNSHLHAIADVDGLQTELNGKAPTVHQHAISQVETLQAELNGKATINHRHLFGDINELDTAFHTVHQNFESNLSEILKLQAQMNDHQHSITQVTELQTVITELESRIAVLDPMLNSVNVSLSAHNLYGMIGVSPVLTPLNIHINKVEFRFRINGAIVHVTESPGLLGVMIPVNLLGIPLSSPVQQIQIQVEVFTPHASRSSGWMNHLYQMQASHFKEFIESYFEQNFMSKLNDLTPAVIAAEIAKNETAISMISDELAFNRNFTNSVAIIQR